MPGTQNKLIKFIKNLKLECNQSMVYGVVEWLSDDPVSIAVSIYWSLYSETTSSEDRWSTEKQGESSMRI